MKEKIIGALLLIGLTAAQAQDIQSTYAKAANLTAVSNTVSAGGLLLWNGNPLASYPSIIDECMSATIAGGLGFTSSTSGGTVTLLGAQNANHFGVYVATTGTTTTGMGNLRTGVNIAVFGSRTVRLIECVKTPAALSDGTDTYEIYTGWGDSTTAGDTGSAPGIVDGAFFKYTHSLASGNWVGRTGSGGTFTTASGGTDVAVTASAYWWLGVEGNSTSFKFYVTADSNGAPGTWTLIGTSASNLPTSGTTGFIHEIIKSAGTTDRSWYLDKVILIP